MSTGIAHLPSISDPDILHALRQLMAVNWTEISDEAKDAVEAAVTKKTDDALGLEELKNAWRVAEAVEKFSGILVSLRMALDDYSGASGDVCNHMIHLLFNLDIVEDSKILSLYEHVGSHYFLINLKFDMLANSMILSFLQMY